MKIVPAVWKVLAASVGLTVITIGALSMGEPGFRSVPDLPNLARQSAPAGPATGPLQVSPTNGRYFTDGSGKAVYLTGSHTWNSLQDLGTTDPPAAFDFDEYLRFLREHRHNFIRLWHQETSRSTQPGTGKPIFRGPHPWQRGGTQQAFDGRPRFDLTRFDQTYFDRLRARVQAAGESGMYVSIMLFEGWAMRFAPDAWLGHPFNPANNINGIDCDLNHDGKGLDCFTLGNPAVTRLQEAYVRKVIDTVNDLDNVLYEISNENNWDSYDWEVHLVRYIHEYEKRKPKQHPVGMTSNGGGGRDDTARLFDSPADWISPNSLKYDYKANPPAATGQVVIIPDTDHLWGLGGDRPWVWKSFLRGLNPIFMDPYREQVLVLDNDAQRQQWESVRRAMGHTAWFASRLDLNVMEPLPELASTGYVLANPGSEYLVYLPVESEPGESGGLFRRLGRPIRNLRANFALAASVDLSANSGEFDVEWFNPANGETIHGDPVAGGGRRSFTAPFTGDAVLYLRRTR